jgi:hypothetical protein
MMANLPICIACSNPKGFRREPMAIARSSWGNVLDRASVPEELELE